MVEVTAHGPLSELEPGNATALCASLRIVACCITLGERIACPVRRIYQWHLTVHLPL